MMDEIICINSSEADIQLVESEDEKDTFGIIDKSETKESKTITNFSDEELSDLECFISLNHLIEMGGDFKARAEIIMGQFSSSETVTAAPKVASRFGNTKGKIYKS